MIMQCTIRKRGMQTKERERGIGKNEKAIMSSWGLGLGCVRPMTDEHVACLDQIYLFIRIRRIPRLRGEWECKGEEIAGFSINQSIKGPHKATHGPRRSHIPAPPQW